MDTRLSLKKMLSVMKMFWMNTPNRNYQWVDVYSAGKSLAKLGRLAVISDELHDKDPVRYSAMTNVSNNIRDSLKLFLAKWLNGGSSILPNIPPSKKDSIIYDRIYGGLISSRSSVPLAWAARIRAPRKSTSVLSVAG